MENGLIKVEDTDLFFKKCTCCGAEMETKKITLGSKNKSESFVLCKNCRESLYEKLEMSLNNKIIKKDN